MLDTILYGKKPSKFYLLRLLPFVIRGYSGKTIQERHEDMERFLKLEKEISTYHFSSVYQPLCKMHYIRKTK